MLDGDIPSAYRRIDWLQSTGSAYIITDIVFYDNDFYIECDFTHTKKSGAEQPIFSTWNSNFQYWNAFITSANLFDVYTAGHHRSHIELMLGQQYHATLKREKTYSNTGYRWVYTATVSDDSFTWNTAVQSKINDIKMRMFKRGDNNNNSNVKIHGCKVWISGVLTGNFIPCIRKSDSEPGMYDTVSRQFYTNAGTGTFVIPS